MGLITTWSPSKVQKYNECPLKAKLETVDKLCPKCFAGKMKGWKPAKCDGCGVEEEMAPPLKRGDEIHGHAEQYVTGRVKGLHPDLKSVKELINKFKAGYKKNAVKVEMEIAIDSKWKRVEYFSKSVWARFKLDVWSMIDKVPKVIDWKTGRFKPSQDYQEQLHAYSTVVVSVGLAPEAGSQLVFTDHGEVVDGPLVLLKNIAKEQKSWEKTVRPMMSDTKFAPRPGDYCKWCNFSKNKDGPCEY